MSPKVEAAQKGIEQILEAMAGASCPNGCKCIFCRTFEQDYQAALEDAELHAKIQLKEHKAKNAR